MKKRTFLKISSAAMTGAALSPLAGCNNPDKNAAPQSSRKSPRLKNWAGNLEYSTDQFIYPESRNNNE